MKIIKMIKIRVVMKIKIVIKIGKRKEIKT